jgi:hypothetical protein
LILFSLIGLLAEEAVISELVSPRLFPVTRENTGKFAIFGLENSQGASAFGAKINRLATKFPSRQCRENLQASRYLRRVTANPYPNNGDSLFGADTTTRKFKSWPRNQRCLHLDHAIL